MTITVNMRVMPDFPIEAQVFYVTSFTQSGGFTLGGSRSESPEPSGVGSLKITPSLIKTELDSPLGSWLLSNMTGEVLITKLWSHTPQIHSTETLDIRWDNNQPWDNGHMWSSQEITNTIIESEQSSSCLLYTSPSPRDRQKSRMPSSA